MPEENYQKIKLLKIMEILRQETDEEHPMTKVELAARLVAMNVSCSPRSLIRDIKLLNEQGYEIMERLSELQNRFRTLEWENNRLRYGGHSF